jgi:hypothetical protein
MNSSDSIYVDTTISRDFYLKLSYLISWDSGATIYRTEVLNNKVLYPHVKMSVLAKIELITWLEATDHDANINFWTDRTNV